MRVIQKLSKRPLLARSIIGLLVLLYLAGSLQLDSLHQLFHQHDESYAHTEELELNACHRTVFHQATKNTCEHPTHLSELKNCPWCNGSLHYETILSEFSLKEDFDFSESKLGYFRPESVQCFIITRGSRGPPDPMV